MTNRSIQVRINPAANYTKREFRPRVSHILDATGEFQNHAQKRYDDTDLLIAEFDERSRRVADATMDMVRNWLPFGTRWLVLPSTNALIDPPMRKSFGFGRPSKLLRVILKTLLKLRGFAVSVLPKRTSPAFFCDVPTRTYRKDGYEFPQLGPAPKKSKKKNTSDP
jgi:hypothetical protein